MAFVGCQKDNDFSNDNLEGGVTINKDSVYHTLKTPFLKKMGWTYVLKNDGTLKRFRTLKIRDLRWKIAQEWLLDDLACGNEMFLGVSLYPGDTHGYNHGLYLLWDKVADTADDGFDRLCYRTLNYDLYDIPFRLPRTNRYYDDDGDFDRLAKIIGSTAEIPNVLEMDYDGYFSPSDNTIHRIDEWTCYWMEARRTFYASMLHPNCGVVARWQKDGSGVYSHWFLTTPYVKMNVRLVRDITPAEW